MIRPRMDEMRVIKKGRTKRFSGMRGEEIAGEEMSKSDMSSLNSLDSIARLRWADGRAECASYF
jgi:hypothetical protein